MALLSEAELDLEIDDRFKQMIKTAVEEAKQLPSEMRQSGISITVSAGRDDSTSTVYDFACADLERVIHIQEIDGNFVFQSLADDLIILPNTDLTLEDAIQLLQDDDITEIVETMHESSVSHPRFSESLREILQPNDYQYPSEETCRLALRQTPSGKYRSAAKREFIGQCSQDGVLEVYISQSTDSYSQDIGMCGAFNEDETEEFEIEFESDENSISTISASSSSPEKALQATMLALVGLENNLLQDTQISTTHLTKILQNPVTTRALQHSIVVSERDLETYLDTDTATKRI